jgi:hypothetical protein
MVGAFRQRELDIVGPLKELASAKMGQRQSPFKEMQESTKNGHARHSPQGRQDFYERNCSGYHATKSVESTAQFVLLHGSIVAPVLITGFDVSQKATINGMGFVGLIERTWDADKNFTRYRINR